MSKDARQKGIKKLPDKVKGKITLPEIDREYTLYEIATSMSAGPARALGLTNKGNLGVGCDADLVMYEEDANIQRMFGHPRYVIKGGEIVIEDGEILEAPQGREFLVRPEYDASVDEFIRPLFEDHYTMSFENYPVEFERIEHPVLRTCAPVKS
jgi:formylmethanofuran dehydrogenase subunit A